MTGNDSLPSLCFFVFQRYPAMIPSKYKLFLVFCWVSNVETCPCRVGLGLRV